MSNFFTRTITGILFVAIMAFCICWNFWTMIVLFGAIVFLGLWEYYTLLEKANYHPQKFCGILIGVLIFLFPLNEIITYTLPLLVFSLLPLELFRNSENPFTNISLTILGFVYVSLPFTFLCYTPAYFRETSLELAESYFPNLILGFFILIWSNDTFAYLVGRGIGKTKLWERISPKKTWEGFAGGLILTQASAGVLSIYFSEIALIHWLVIAAIVSVFGTLGDLVESMFKRSLNVKDSGGILPGHGGLLDRFDGALLSAPFVCTYLMLMR